MKVLHGDEARCRLAKACERACAHALHKEEESAYSAIRVGEADGRPSFNVCNQCGECIPICPSGALTRNKSGTVLVKKKLCVACYMCIGFCPTSSMFRVEGDLPPFKCIVCGKCVKACPHNALELVEESHEGLPR
jgi:carbon-monoxide dehydrogenase iron sulfur subunit